MGRILGYHRDSGRNVFGLSSNGRKRAKQEALRWWTDYLNRVRPAIRVPEQVVNPPPLPPPYRPRTGPKRAPVAPYSTGPRFYRNGKLVQFDIPVGTHIDKIVGVGVKPMKR